MAMERPDLKNALTEMGVPFTSKMNTADLKKLYKKHKKEEKQVVREKVDRLEVSRAAVLTEIDALRAKVKVANRNSRLVAVQRTLVQLNKNALRE